MIGLLANGTQQRKGCIQYQRGIVGLADKLIGCADLDRTVIPEAASHTAPTQHAVNKQSGNLTEIVKAKRPRLTDRRLIAFIKEEYQHEEQQYQVPMAHKLVANNAA